MILNQGIFRNLKNIILGSGSPRRQMLLSQLGIYFEVVPANAKEPAPLPGDDPAHYALQTASFKATAIRNSYRKPGVLITADTIVVLEDKIIGKPKDTSQALNMLKGLCGKTHQVFTACILQQDTKKTLQFVVKTKVTLSQQPETIIRQYVQTGEPLDKAGCYAIQGAGGFLVEKIEGSYSNVVGLPLTEIVQGLLTLKAIEPLTT